MRPLSEIAIKVLTCLLIMLLLPGWVEIAESALGPTIGNSTVVNQASSADACCDDALSISAYADGVDSYNACTPTCEHCWCCGSLPALASMPDVRSKLLWIAATVATPGPSPQAPPLRAIPPPVRPPIL